MTEPTWRDGPTWVGERGPEFIDLPPGSQIIPRPLDGGDDE